MIIRAQIVISARDSVPRDAAVNVIHWTADITEDALGLGVLLDDITGEIRDFYSENQLDDTGSSIDDSSLGRLLSPIMSRDGDGVLVRYFHVVDATHENFLDERTFGLSDPLPDAAAMPNELAICCSLLATPSLSVPIRRRRGRLYLGPINSGPVGTRTISGVEYPSVSSLARGYIARSLKRLTFAADRIDAQWCVYSRKNDAAYTVTQGWVDNEFDIIRSRGLEASLRTDFENPGSGPTELP